MLTILFIDISAGRCMKSTGWAHGGASVLDAFMLTKKFEIYIPKKTWKLHNRGREELEPIATS